jgi:hypothetical protein
LSATTFVNVRVDGVPVSVAGVTALPLNAMLKLEFKAFDVMETLPLKLFAEGGVKVTVHDASIDCLPQWARYKIREKGSSFSGGTPVTEWYKRDLISTQDGISQPTCEDSHVFAVRIRHRHGRTPISFVRNIRAGSDRNK